MKRITTIICTLALAFQFASAQGYVESGAEFLPKSNIRPAQTVLLYPEGQAAGKGITEDGVAITLGPREDNELRGPESFDAIGNRGNVGDDARMDFYFPAKGNGKLVIVAPGGGYGRLSSFNEGVYVAKWLTDNGFVACVLKYRMPYCHPTVPFDDMDNAMRYCRYHAEGWGVKMIGVMGFSAGGHLCAYSAAKHADKVTRPDFAVLAYPRITLRRGEKSGTKHNLFGHDEDWKGREAELDRLLAEWSPENYVNADTCPCFMVLCADDKSVNATNALPFYSALVANHINVEMHVYPTGGHGWGFSYEKYKGEGRDHFLRYRADFESNLLRWINAL